jgi:hypothetical protein
VIPHARIDHLAEGLRDILLLLQPSGWGRVSMRWPEG